MALIIVGIFIFICFCLFVVKPTIEGTKQLQEHKFKQKCLEEQAENLLIYGKDTVFGGPNPYFQYMIKPQWKNWFICGYKEGYANKDIYDSLEKINKGVGFNIGEEYTEWDRENSLSAYYAGYKEGEERKRLENPKW